MHNLLMETPLAYASLFRSLIKSQTVCHTDFMCKPQACGPFITEHKFSPNGPYAQHLCLVALWKSLWLMHAYLECLWKAEWLAIWPLCASHKHVGYLEGITIIHKCLMTYTSLFRELMESWRACYIAFMHKPKACGPFGEYKCPPNGPYMQCLCTNTLWIKVLWLIYPYLEHLWKPEQLAIWLLHTSRKHVGYLESVNTLQTAYMHSL